MALEQKAGYDVQEEAWTAHPRSKDSLEGAFGPDHQGAGIRLISLLVNHRELRFERGSVRGLPEALGGSALTSELPQCPFADRCHPSITFSGESGDLDKTTVTVACDEISGGSLGAVSDSADQCLAHHRRILELLGPRAEEIVDAVEVAHAQQSEARRQIAALGETIGELL